MNKNRSLFNSAKWNIVSVSINAIVWFYTLPIIIRSIGSDSFGFYSIILMLGGFAAFQDLGLGEATLRYVSKYYFNNDYESINRVLRATLSVYLVIGSIVSITFVFLAPQIVSIFKINSLKINEAVYSLRIASIGFLFITIANALQKIPEAIQRYDLSSKVEIILTILHGSMMLLVIKMDFGIIGLVFVLTLKAMLKIIIFLIVSNKLIPGLIFIPSFKIKDIKEVFSYGIFSFGNQLLGNISLYIDRFLMGTYLGTAEVSYLTVPKDILSRISSLISASGRALFPRFSSIEGKKNENIKLYTDSTWLLLNISILIFLPLTIVLPEFLSLWISDEFAMRSSATAQLISLSFIFNGITHVYFGYLKGSGKIHWLTIMYTISVCISIIIAIILINYFGLLGAGYRFLILGWTSIIFSTYTLKKGLNPKGYLILIFRSIFLPLIVSALSGIFMYYFWNYLNLSGWIWLIVFYVFFVIVLGLLLIVSDIIFFPIKGVSAILISRFKKLLIIKKHDK